MVVVATISTFQLLFGLLPPDLAYWTDPIATHSLPWGPRNNFCGFQIQIKKIFLVNCWPYLINLHFVWTMLKLLNLCFHVWQTYGVLRKIIGRKKANKLIWEEGENWFPICGPFCNLCFVVECIKRKNGQHVIDLVFYKYTIQQLLKIRTGQPKKLYSSK